ncbi:hypothetical protein HQ945_08935 [Phyllobacterium sp. BT25]|uniref:Chromosomal replication initiator DnaA C-terminal domain-containing protein n=1 Tax=Phyllobacterium pellucidum TaxID=2740464 RepID=A0A849VPK1_9HYPH|nr:helix-turn-helix domain-containing protein [Phyllobacterium pellucidum]NTS31376.1 hypothetical protein [Phyllobacterium pellucidum]
MLKLGSRLEASPAYQRAVAAQRAKESAKAAPGSTGAKLLPMPSVMGRVINLPIKATSAEVDDAAERWRLYTWLLNAEYNSDKPSGAAIVEFNARKHGLKVDDLKGDRRIRTIVEAKYDAIEDLHRKRPDLSLPEIGRLLNKDHTTVLHALRKRGLKYKPRPQSFDPDKARRLYQSGLTNNEVAIAMDFAVETVRRATSPIARRGGQ